MPKVEFTCVVCGEKRLLYPSQLKKRKACSKKCQAVLLKDKFKGENNPNFNHRWSDELRKRMGMVVKKRMENPENRIKSASNKGRKFSEEVRHKMSVSQLQRDTYSKHSEESKKKIGEKSKAKWTEEYKERICRSRRRGKKKKMNGYVLIKDYENPSKNSQNDILEHRKVMEDVLGRRLKKGEVVHHINFVRDDNRPENLYLYSERKLHNREKKSIFSLVKDLIDLNIIYFEKGEYKMNREVRKMEEGGKV